MSQQIEIIVHGVPKPAGSKRAFIVQRKGTKGTNRKDFTAVVTDANENAKDWKADVQQAARAAYRGPALTGPLRLEIWFYMPRPKHHFRSNGHLKEDAPIWHTITPDSTKLIRGTEDALTGFIWRDDSQVCIQSVEKLYEPVEEPSFSGPGCRILVTALSEQEKPDGEAPSAKPGVTMLQPDPADAAKMERVREIRKNSSFIYGDDMDAFPLPGMEDVPVKAAPDYFVAKWMNSHSVFKSEPGGGVRHVRQATAQDLATLPRKDL